MSLAHLLTSSTRPLFVIGSSKGTGKTVTLNRLRTDARQSGSGGFGILSTGWDGERYDHLTGEPKPKVHVYPGDFVATASHLLASSAARIEIIHAESLSGPLGRLVAGKVIRGGDIELVGPATIGELRFLISTLQREGATRVLIDGAVDRKTPLAAWPEADVCLVFRPDRNESIPHFVSRVAAAASIYRLKQTKRPRPENIQEGHIALGNGNGWQVVPLIAFDSTTPSKESNIAWVCGPLTQSLGDTLLDMLIEHVIMDDPSDVFVPPSQIKRWKNRGMAFELGTRPIHLSISIRSEGGSNRDLPPEETLVALSEAIPDLVCFDPWLVEQTSEEAA